MTRMTFQEAHRRWVLWAVVLMGLAFVAIFATGVWLVNREISQYSAANEVFEMGDFFILAGLYAVNFLVVVLAALTSVDTISGEIASGTIQTLVTKPLQRWEVVVGKWLGLGLMLTLFAVGLAGSVVGTVWAITGYVPQNPVQGIALIALGGLVVLTLSILGGTRLSTLPNGVIVLMAYSLAFIGGWIEQFGSFLGNQAAMNIGIVIRLMMPAEALWKRAAYLMEPPLLRAMGIHPLSAVNSPSPAMVGYTALYVGVALLVAVRVFARRDL